MSNVAENISEMPVEISDLVTPDRVEVHCGVGSRKRLLERLTELLTEGRDDVTARIVFQTLVDRERLGSTGIGHGVALPHGRVAGLEQPVGAVAVLDEPLDYDALDGEPIRLAFGLLVPAEATEQHLRILARLARLFSDSSLRRELLATASNDQCYQRLITAKLQD